MKYEETAKRLTSAMSNAGIKAVELAERSGVSKSSISQYTNGSHAPSNISSGKMASVLGVNPVWLMGFDAPMVETITPTDDEADLIRRYRMLDDFSRGKVSGMIDGLLHEKKERMEDNINVG